MEPADSPTEPIPVAAAEPSRRRRRAAVTLGLVALPVVGSAFVLPAIANAHTATAGASAAQVAPAAVSAPGTVPDETALQAYFDAGYTFDDAVAVAQRWSTGADLYRLKVELGG